MSDFNTFSGKSVDDAILNACRFFAVERDKLEIEIVTGGSTGIFGLVGKKLAEIRARRRRDPLLAMNQMQREQEQAPPETTPDQPRSTSQKTASETDKPAKPKPPRQREQQAKPKDQERPKRDPAPQRTQAQKPPRPQEQPSRPQEQPLPTPAVPAETAQADFAEDDLPATESQAPASQELIDLATEIMRNLLTPILEEEPALEIEGTAARVNVLIRDEAHSGLLIGREGQTLAALQYLANRILARRWPQGARLQINTGEYREKQDDNLRKMALFLADKARNLGKPQSTKPLSSYHRRVIHLALQADETIQTRSKGEGPMKRVIIVPKRPKAETPST